MPRCPPVLVASRTRGPEAARFRAASHSGRSAPRMARQSGNPLWRAKWRNRAARSGRSHLCSRRTSATFRTLTRRHPGLKGGRYYRPYCGTSRPKVVSSIPGIGWRRNGRQYRFAPLQQMLDVPPVELVVDVGAFVSLRQEGGHDGSGDVAATRDHPGPGDFEAGILNINFRKGGILRAVPWLLRWAERQQRHHTAPAHDPHLARVFSALLDRPQRIDALLGEELLPSPSDRLRTTEGAG